MLTRITNARLITPSDILEGYELYILDGVIHRITPEDAIPMLLHQSYCPLDPEKRVRFEELISLLAEKTLLWQMACNMDPSAAEVSHSAMCR